MFTEEAPSEATAGCSTLTSVPTPSRTVRTSEAESGLSSGFFANNLNISASSALGHALLCQVGDTGGVLMCWPMMAMASSPMKGGRPVTISYIMAPREYRSALAVTSPPMACSGGM